MPRLKKKTNSQRLSLDRRRKRTGQDGRYSKCPGGGVDDSTIDTCLRAQDNHCLEFGIHEESFHGISPEDVMNGELEIQILKTQFNVTHGLHLPSFLYALEKSKRTCTKIPNSASNVVQIHIIPGHYLISAFQNGQLRVYDSLYNRQHVLQLIPQLNLLYDSHVINNLQYSCPQSQGFSVLCGFYALANSVSCLLGESVGGTPLDASKMRNHLRECLMNGTFQAFPRLMPTVSHTPIEQTSTSTLTDNTFHAISKFEIELQNEFERFKVVRKRRCSKTRVKTESSKQMKFLDRGNLTISFEDNQKKNDVGKEIEEENAVIVNNQQQFKEKNTEVCHRFRKDSLHAEYRGKIKEKDRIRKRKERRNCDKIRKMVCLNRDRSKHKEIRDNLTEKERNQIRELNAIQHRERRQKFTDEEREKKCEDNRLQQQKHRDNLTEEERGNKREEDRIQHQKQRNNLKEEERGNKREENKLQQQKHRDNLTQEEKVN